MRKNLKAYATWTAASISTLMVVVPLVFSSALIPDTPQFKRQLELELRSQKGDISAIRELAHGDFYPSVESKAHVALGGAILGDEELQREYFSYFHAQVAPEERAKQLEYYRGELSGPALECYFKLLTESTYSSACAIPPQSR